MRYVINKTPAASSHQVMGKPTHDPSPWVVLNPPAAAYPLDLHGAIPSIDDVNYAAARAGTGRWLYDPVWGLGQAAVGQSTFINFYGDQVWYCNETFLSFGSPPAASATLRIFMMSVQTGEDPAVLDQSFTLEVREYDFGATLESGDWAAGANLGSYTLLGSMFIPTSVPAGWYEVSLTAASTHLILCSDRHRSGTAPVLGTPDEWINITDAELVV